MFTELGFAVFCQPQGQDFARTPAQYTYYHLPPASTESPKSSSADLKRIAVTDRTCSKLQNSLQETCPSIIRGVVELR